MPAVAFPPDLPRDLRKIVKRIERLERQGRAVAPDKLDGHPVLVAASDSPFFEVERAHFVCDGTDDHEEITAALTLAGGGRETYGQVQLAQGTFVADLNQIIVDNARLSGRGAGQTTVNFTEAAAATDYGFQVGGDYGKVSDLLIGRTGGVAVAARAINVTDAGGNQPRYFERIESTGLWDQFIGSPQSGGGGTASWTVVDCVIVGDLLVKENYSHRIERCRIDGDIVVSTSVTNGNLLVDGNIFLNGHGIGSPTWTPQQFEANFVITNNVLGYVRADLTEGHALIAHNIFRDDTESEIAIRAGSWSEIIGNVFHDANYEKAIQIEGDVGGLDGRACIIAHNIIESTTDTAIYVYHPGLSATIELKNHYIVNNLLIGCTGNYEIAFDVNDTGAAASSVDTNVVAHNVARDGNVICGIYFENTDKIGTNNLCWGNDMLSTYSTGALCLNGKARTVPSGHTVPPTAVETNAVGPMIPGAGIVRTKPQDANLDAVRAHALMLGGM